jgi:putative two-component system response regulator
VPSALRDALAMIVRGYEVAGQPNAALVYLHEVIQFTGDSRVRSVLEHHRLHLAKVTRNFDHQAQVALEQQKQELRFARLSMDVLRECMQVLEKNTRRGGTARRRDRGTLLSRRCAGQGVGPAQGDGRRDVHAD